MSVQDSFIIVERLAALCATPGISEGNIKKANDHIEKILNGPINKAITELSAASSGIITK